jgi:hypothetical protein
MTSRVVPASSETIAASRLASSDDDAKAVAQALAAMVGEMARDRLA